MRTNKSRGRFGGKLKKKLKNVEWINAKILCVDTYMLSAIFTSLQPALGQSQGLQPQGLQPQGLQAALGRPHGLEPEGL